MEKNFFRSVIKNKLQNSINNNENNKLYSLLFSDTYWKKARVIAITLSTSIEINTQPIINKALEEHKVIVAPIISNTGKMNFYKINNNSKFKRNKKGILEPVNSCYVGKKSIDLIIVPGLIFNLLNHHRIGFGGGYYDRYLKNYSGFTLSLARHDQIVTNNVWIPDSFDVKVDKILTL